MNQHHLYKRFSPDSNLSIQAQITQFMRELISRGEIMPEDRIPALRDLATLWDTNYFTVNAAMKDLVKEGVLVRRPRLGTFVQKRKMMFDAVGIYCDGDLIGRSDSAFYSALHTILLEKLKPFRSLTRLFIDKRPNTEKSKPLPELIDSIREGKVNYLIGIRIQSNLYTWLSKLEIPFTTVSGAKYPLGVYVTHAEAYTEVIARMQALGCKSMGLITHGKMKPASDGTPSGAQLLVDAAKQVGMTVKPEWIFTSDNLPIEIVPDTEGNNNTLTLEEVGYRMGVSLCKQKTLPDAVYIYPDITFRGAVTALREYGIRVPEQMVVIAERNRQIPVFTPFPTDFIVNDIEAIADALLSHLIDIAQGKPTECRIVPASYSFSDQVAALRKKAIAAT